MARVALVGVGTMGLPIGRRLVAAGHDVVACDLDPGHAAELGSRVAPTPAEAVAEAEVAITSLPSVAAVEAAVLGAQGLLGAARPGTVLIEMSTSSPSLARRLAAEAAPRGVHVLDAPVSGGPVGAEAGTLTIMVGGPAEVLGGVRELLGCIGTVVHAGVHGAGQALKLCNNLLAGCAMAALAEACALAVEEGLDPGVLYEAVSASTGDSRVLRNRFPLPGVDPKHPASNEYRPLFSLDLLVKDLLLARAEADAQAVATPVAGAALAAFQRAQRAGLGGLDYSAVFLTTRREARPAEPPAPRRFPEPVLRSFGERALEQCGAPPAVARLVLDCLLEADRRGVHTHGLLRLPAYCAQARAGEIDAAATPELLVESGPTALVDGRLAFGAVSCTFAVDDAVRRAREHGIGATAVRNGTHFGSAGHYSLRIAREGLAGLVATSTTAAMAPYGAAEGRLGNNPLSIAAPAGQGRPPLVLDMALSTVSRGAIKLAELNGRAIPEGWALDADGNATTDPAAALAGALLPLGGHKGSGLAIAVEALTAALAGAEISPRLVNTGLTGGLDAGASPPAAGAGYLVIAIDPARFAGQETFVSRLGDLCDELKASRLAPGFDELLVPGELEHRSELRAGAEGVLLPAATVEALRALAAAETVSFP
jgi:3-hydroxyisobutyrate dehydrogenase